MLIQFSTAFPKCSRAWYLFHKPIMNGWQSNWRQVTNLFFHIITLGIPFLFYHVISYCLTKFSSYLLKKAAAAICGLRQELLDFARQKLSEETDIKEDFDWSFPRGSYSQLPITVVPKNPDISRLAALYWDKYAFEFQTVFKEHSKDGEDPWTSEAVLVKAEEWLKIGCSIMMLTIDDIQNHIDEKVKKDRSCDIKKVNYDIKHAIISHNYWYAREALCHIWHVYTLLKIGVGWDNDTNTWRLPEDIYSKTLENYEATINDFPSRACSDREGRKLIKGITNLRYVNIKGRTEFYQEGTHQAKCRKLYNDCHLLLHYFLRMHFKQDTLLIPLDDNINNYEACAMYDNWLK